VCRQGPVPADWHDVFLDPLPEKSDLSQSDNTEAYPGGGKSAAGTPSITNGESAF
jgi:hypothetical protein